MNPLAEHVRATLRPLEVEGTRFAPKLPKLPGIRAVVFDLYGTLLISAAGGEGGPRRSDPEDLPGLGRALEEAVLLQQDRRRGEGVEFPEVEIRNAWTDALRSLGKPQLPPNQLELAVLSYECRVNPVWTMPNAAATLSRLREEGCLLGIVSNAQFYTLPVMEGLFGAGLDELGFHPRLRVFSFEEGEGKPSPRLFSRLARNAAALGVSPREILHVGNDFDKDVLPARAAGFRTALFAGDSRSVRLGDTGETDAIAAVDAVVTDLAQVPALREGD